MPAISPGAVLGAEYEVLAAGSPFTPTVAGIFIPSSALTEASEAELDPTTGNLAELMRSLMKQCADYIAGLDAASRPLRWRVTKANPAIANITGQTGVFYRQDYTSSHDIQVVSGEAAPEA